MRIAIIGRSEILYETAVKARQKGHELSIIMTAPEAPEYTKKAGDFERLAIEIGAGFLNTADINSETARAWLTAYPPLDIGFSMNYPGLIGQQVIDLFRLGILNAHGGDLPRYRGNACQAWAIINGEEKIGLCIHRMLGGQLDTGDVICRAYLPIHIDTKIAEVWAWMASEIPELFLHALELLDVDPCYKLDTPSTDPQAGLRCYPRIPEDGRISWSAANVDILRLINASGKPYGGAFCTFEGRKITIWDADLYADEENVCAVPGQITTRLNDTGDVIVITGKGKLRVKLVEVEGFLGKPAELIKSTRVRLQ